MTPSGALNHGGFRARRAPYVVHGGEAGIWRLRPALRSGLRSASRPAPRKSLLLSVAAPLLN